MHRAKFMGHRRRLSFRPVAVVMASVIGIVPASRARAQGRPSPPAMAVAQPTRVVTLAEALAYAREHEPSIRAALSNVSARMAEARIPSGQWLPTVGATAQLYGMTSNNSSAMSLSTDWMDLPRIGGTPAVGSLSDTRWQPVPSTLVGVGVQQQVFDFGRIAAERAAADALVDVQRHRLEVTRLDVDFGVGEAYFSVRAAKAIVNASDEAYERALVHRDFAKRGVESGLRPPIELTRAEADLARFDVGRVRARGGVAVAQAVLAAAIGSTDPAVDASDQAVHRSEMPTLAEAVRLAQSRDPALAEALAELQAAERKTVAVGAALRPDLSLTATLSGRAGGAPVSTRAGPATPAGGGWVPDVPNWDVGLLLSWPLFDGTTAARREAAKSAEQLQRDEVEVVRLQDIAHVRETFSRVEVARSALAALQNSVTAARANYDQADARFRAGIGNAVELADAESVRVDAEIQLAIGEFELARARAAFGRAIAEGL